MLLRDYFLRKEIKRLTKKNFSHSFSNGREPGLRNMKAILAVLGWGMGIVSRSRMTTLAANSSSVFSLVGRAGNQSLNGVHTLEAKK
jgi:hypothetical protein